jgi:DNA invertase Pin-like site-specific DNA recombinase
MKIGYARVSKTDEQTTALQRNALQAAGVDLELGYYEDQISGSVPGEDRPGLKACLKTLRPGDTLVVWKLDRLGRSVSDLISTVQNCRFAASI